DAKALIAGNDIMEYTENLPAAIKEIRKAIKNGELTEEQVNESCHKNLMAKYWVGLNEYKPVEMKGLDEYLNRAYPHWLRQKLYEEALTVLKNENDILPIKDLVKIKTVVVDFGNTGDVKGFYERFDDIEYVQVNSATTYEKLTDGRDASTKYVAVVQGAGSVLKEEMRLHLFAFLAKKQHTIVVWHENPYKLAKIPEAAKADGLIVTYQNNSTVRDVASQLVFGAIGATGRLPVSVKGLFSEGDGIDVEPLGRLSYTYPEETGLVSENITTKVDSIMNTAIEAGAFPGGCVLVAKDSKVIFHKAYGWHTFQKNQQVKKDDIFDLASVTKISGPLPLIMQAYQNKMLDVDEPMSRYWKDWRKSLFHPSNKSDLTFREILAHQAGLEPYINYYPMTLKDGEFNERMYSINEDEKHNLHISQNLYLEDRFKKKVYKAIRKSPLLPEKKYKYSGLSFMIYPQMLSELYNSDYTGELYNDFFEPLGATTTRYTPLKYFSRFRILPTERDSNYRKELVWGYVHDEAAAVMGGVSGNAGLFSNANDLAKLMQMYLNGGVYGGKRYISEDVIKEFTKVQYPDNDNRRGMGFDKPLFNNSSYTIENSYPAPGVSQESFGHSGFTGIFVWMDPEYNLLYIFMSNRVYPTRENKLIYKLNVRPSVHQVFYDEIENHLF
ncbi:MAG: serine hydrolase, partial [Chlorobi bacterium]|nr:serine hydrolase [Chlorobiota bacterium]